LNAKRLVVLSGCSGGGKTTLLAELKRRGFAVVEEPGRQIVREQLESGGIALPWQDAHAFIELVLSHSVANYCAALEMPESAFFDRGVVDAVNYFPQHKLAMPKHFSDATERCRYHSHVFLAPPWEEIFGADRERRHTFASAVAEYESLTLTYPKFGYEIMVLPKVSVQARADFVLSRLESI
jgi:predicted ATPase